MTLDVKKNMIANRITMLTTMAAGRGMCASRDAMSIQHSRFRAPTIRSSIHDTTTAPAVPNRYSPKVSPGMFTSAAALRALR